MEKRKSILNEISLIILGGSVLGSLFVGILVYFLLSSSGVPDAPLKAVYSTIIIQIAFLIPVYLIRLLIDKYIVSKIKEVSKALQEVSTGNLDYKIKAEGNDELAELAESFERMRLSMKTIMEKLEEGEI
ncbi:HAMP domain-containing protein [Persephonella hydrogeniphila]|uniref:histidine kinase n=1 Tax=Persephonella hydrogeniphila TaxID=198703 RepID=A0A285MZL4_9AQUI|nr:HAMP domain-containing protein [Persephonella hydrogeniphila]SNZ02123.1 HAMP domain-containing protein [Persephonella hydrogeniphila]